MQGRQDHAGPRLVHRHHFVGKNLADLDKYKDTAQRLALVKGLNDAQAHELAHNGKVIVHIDGGLHATEVAPAQHTIQLAYNLVTGNDPETTAILDNVILLLWFSINPDGQNMVVDWYREQSRHAVRSEQHARPVAGIHRARQQSRRLHEQHDRVAGDHAKPSSNIIRTVFYNHHQTAPFPARIWIPPFGDPVSLNPHPLMYRWVNVFGTSMAAYLDEHDMPGAMHRGRFDDWYPGLRRPRQQFPQYGFVPDRDGAVSLRDAAFLHHRRISRATSRICAPRSFIRVPWSGGWWRLGDAVRYMLGSSMAVLDTAAKNREELLYDRYRAGRDVIARFTKDPPYAYIIPREQRDTPTAAMLVEKLMIDGIEVHQATSTISRRTARRIRKATGWC